MAQLVVVIVPPAPGLTGLVHDHHVSRVLAASNVADANVLQSSQAHWLVDVVLGVVVVLLQLAGLQSLQMVKCQITSGFKM